MRTLMVAGAVVVLGCGSPSVALDPPPPGQGFQLKVPEFEVESGVEVQDCYFFEVPRDLGPDVWVHHIQLAQTDGSHHMNVFRVKTVKDLMGRDGEVVKGGECWNSANWSDWPLVTNTQQDGNIDWVLPDGVGLKLAPGELLMLQTHYVNATTQKTPARAAVWVNFYTLPAAPVHELGTLFATNQNIQICPGDKGRSFAKSCKFPSDGVSIVAANGHFHSRGRLFEMFTVDPQGTVGEKFYESRSWDDPPMSRDFMTPVAPGGGVQWRCSFDFPEGQCGDGKNPDGSPSCCFTFGGNVETSEHCNAFVYYFPKTVDVNCF